MRSTALCSLRSCCFMNMLYRFLFSSITIVVTSLTTASAQNLPNTTRLLRFPTTNDRDIVFCYAGQLYTVGKDGGTGRRLTLGRDDVSDRMGPNNIVMAWENTKPLVVFRSRMRSFDDFVGSLFGVGLDAEL